MPNIEMNPPQVYTYYCTWFFFFFLFFCGIYGVNEQQMSFMFMLHLSVSIQPGKEYQ